MKHRTANHSPHILRTLTSSVLILLTVMSTSCANFVPRVSAEDGELTQHIVVPYQRETVETSSTYDQSETITGSDIEDESSLPETTAATTESVTTESSEATGPVTEDTSEPPAETVADTTETKSADTAMVETIAAVTTAVTEKPATDKIVYLTFDDGPNKTNTTNILDTLDEYGVKATFFTVGYLVDRYPELVADCAERGHAIGCHSYDHDYARIQKEGELEAEISEWETAISAALGEVPDEKLFRFPGGSTKKSELDLKGKLSELGYKGYDWNCLNNDSMLKKCPADMTKEDWLKKNFTDTYKYGSSLKNAPLIILLHESYTETADMLGWIIEFLQDEGYSFGTLDELDSSWYY